MSRFDYWILGWVRIAEGLCVVLTFATVRPKWGLIVCKKIVRRISNGKTNTS